MTEASSMTLTLDTQPGQIRSVSIRSFSRSWYGLTGLHTWPQKKQQEDAQWQLWNLIDQQQLQEIFDLCNIKIAQLRSMYQLFKAVSNTYFMQ